MKPMAGGVFVALWIMLSGALLGWSGDGFVALFFSLLTAFALFAGYQCNRRPRPWMRVMKGVAVAVGALLAGAALLKGQMLSAMLLLVVFLLLAISFTLSSRREVLMLILGSIGLMLVAMVERERFTLMQVLYLFSVVLVLMQLQLSQVRHQVEQYNGAGSALATLPVFVTILSLSALLYWLMPQPEPPHYELIPQSVEPHYSGRQWEAMADRQARQTTAGAGSTAGAATQPSEGEGRGSGGGTADGGAGREKVLKIGPSGDKGTPELLLRVEGAQPNFLRTLVFDHFDGETWSRSHPAGGDRFHRLSYGVFSRETTLEGEVQRQRIEVVKTLGSELPLTPYALRIDLPANVLKIDAQQNVLLPDALEAGLRYEVVSTLGRVDGRRLIPGSADGVDWLQLPEVAQPLCGWSREIVQGGETMAVARRVESYLLHDLTASDSAVGSLPYHWLDPEWVTQHGLTRAQKLSLMVLMMRCEGVPARLASGYSSKMQNPLTGVWDVTTEHRAAWSEIYLPGQGWVVFVVSDQPGDEPSSWAERALDYVNQRLGMGNQPWHERLALYGVRPLLELLVAYEKASPATRIITAGAAILLILLLLLLWFQRKAIRSWWLDRRFTGRLRRQPDQASIHLFAALEAWMGQHKQHRYPHETASAWLNRLALDYPWLSDWVAPVAQAFNEQRYGQRHGLSAEQAGQHWREFRRLAAEHGWNLKR